MPDPDAANLFNAGIWHHCDQKCGKRPVPAFCATTNRLYRSGYCIRWYKPTGTIFREAAFLSYYICAGGLFMPFFCLWKQLAESADVCLGHRNHVICNFKMVATRWYIWNFVYFMQYDSDLLPNSLMQFRVNPAWRSPLGRKLVNVMLRTTVPREHVGWKRS